MQTKGPYIIYVTVGKPRAKEPIVDKTEVEVDECLEETPVEAARDFRMEIAAKQKYRCNPLTLYYEIYTNPKCMLPWAASTNAPCLNKSRTFR